MAEKTDRLVCPICGGPTRVYMGNARKDKLCAKHANEFKSGLIVQCDECREWHPASEECSCNDSIIYTELPAEGFFECVSCGEKTTGYAFCRDCWKKYSTEEMLDILNGEDDKGDKSFDQNDDRNEETIENTPEQVVENNVVVINENNKSKCITCGKKTDGLLFCAYCYHKYKNKELLFKITN